jgi:3-oxoacyl-[acyl-carrier protein] reductase
MLLDNKTAIVYGAAGAVGSAVAHAYAREGDEGHLAGRTAATLDRTALERHAATVAAASGGIDVCFNVTSTDDRQGTPLLDMQFEDFLRRPQDQSRHRAFSISPPQSVGR